MAVRTAYVGTEAVGDVLTKANFDKLPGGWIGDAQVTANQGSITAQTDITGATVTVTVGANRKIKITGQATPASTVAADQADFYIMEGATQLAFQRTYLGNTNGYGIRAEVVITAPSAGAHTYKLQMGRQGTGIITNNAGATNPTFILVEDIGPSA